MTDILRKVTLDALKSGKTIGNSLSGEASLTVATSYLNIRVAPVLAPVLGVVCLAHTWLARAAL